MTSVQATFMFTGDHFIPAELVAKLGNRIKFTNCRSPGEWSPTEKNHFDYGNAEIEMEGFSGRKIMKKMTAAQIEQYQRESWRKFRNLIAKVYQYHEIIRNAHVDDIELWCNVFDDGQCSMQFDPEDLKKLGEMNVSLSLTCWRGYYSNEY